MTTPDVAKSIPLRPAEPSDLPLLERLGFEFSEHRRFGEGACAVYRLERTRWSGTKLY